MIQIANWILTRKCNLNCGYCAITKDYKNKPEPYPNLSYYFKNEMPKEDMIMGLKHLHNHNPNIFHIFYGGEPMLRDDLPDIIRFCNENNIFYTIITNNSDAVQQKIKYLIGKAGEVRGLTSSVDPIIISGDKSDPDRYKKSIEGFER